MFYPSINMCNQDDDAKKTWFCTINLSTDVIVVATLSSTMKIIESRL